MSTDQTAEEPDAAKVARPVLKSGGRGDPFADCNLLALRKWGVPAMAICGTYLNEPSLHELDGWNRLYVALDADDAGEDATAELVRRFGAKVVRVELPPGAKDPADLAPSPDGAEIFACALRAAIEQHLATQGWVGFSSRKDAAPG